MGKIIKKSVEKIVVNKEKFNLGMKGEFTIEFASDSFGPYNYKFQREDCYFIDGLNDRGSKLFPIKNKKFDNTEIFLETDDIVIAVGERGSLIGGDKSFLDIINIKTEKKYRVFTKEVNLIYNEKDTIVINLEESGEFKTIVLNINTMEKTGEVKEEINAFFKCIYNNQDKGWFLLDFEVSDESEKDEEIKYKNGYFVQKRLSIKGVPEIFNREKFKIKTDLGDVDIWEESIA